MGVESIELDTVNLRMVARTLPGKQFEVGRRMRVLVVRALRRAGIAATADGSAPMVAAIVHPATPAARRTKRRAAGGPEMTSWLKVKLGGRMRVSTAVLLVAFIALFWVYHNLEPRPPPEAPAPAVVPPGFVPDPNYTWVPRTNVRRPKRTRDHDHHDDADDDHDQPDGHHESDVADQPHVADDESHGAADGNHARRTGGGSGRFGPAAGRSRCLRCRRCPEPTPTTHISRPARAKEFPRYTGAP